MPQALSNSYEDFSEGGSLYPGGSGILTDIRYALWDYDGKRAPESQCAVHATMTPTDGSNEGKPVDIFWSVGAAADFQPDHSGGFVMSDTKDQISKSCNWADVNNRFMKTCGLESKDLNGPTGLLNLIGGEITLTRVDQMKREGLDDDQPAEHGQKKQKRTILVPTRFKGVWEKGGKARSAAAPRAAAPRAAAASNGNASGFDLSTALVEIVTEAGGSILQTAVGKALLDKIVAAAPANLPAVRKDAVTQISKDNIEVTAIAAGLSYDPATMTVSL